MAEQQNSPFARVANGYDPKQVAAFAAEALSWKKELASLRTEVTAAGKLVERYESVIGSIEEVEREAAQILENARHQAEALLADAEARSSKLVEEAEDEAARILSMSGTGSVERQPESSIADVPADPHPEAGDGWLAPEPETEDTPDPVEQIFEEIDETSPTEDAAPIEVDVSLERRAAGAANLWKRRGLVAPSE